MREMMLSLVISTLSPWQNLAMSSKASGSDGVSWKKIERSSEGLFSSKEAIVADLLARSAWIIHNETHYLIK